MTEYARCPTALLVMGDGFSDTKQIDALDFFTDLCGHGSTDEKACGESEWGGIWRTRHLSWHPSPDPAPGQHNGGLWSCHRRRIQMAAFRSLCTHLPRVPLAVSRHRA